MEIKFTPVSHEAYLRSLRSIEPTPETLTGSTVSVPSTPLPSPAPTSSANPINWVKLFAGVLVIAGVLYVVHHYFQEDKRKD
jgi:hypothetical protein